jgi:hypothetical protein
MPNMELLNDTPLKSIDVTEIIDTAHDFIYSIPDY